MFSGLNLLKTRQCLNQKIKVMIYNRRVQNHVIDFDHYFARTFSYSERSCLLNNVKRTYEIVKLIFNYTSHRKYIRN